MQLQLVPGVILSASPPHELAQSKLFFQNNRSLQLQSLEFKLAALVTFRRFKVGLSVLLKPNI